MHRDTQKCICGRGFAPDTTGELAALPRPLAGLTEGYPGTCSWTSSVKVWLKACLQSMDPGYLKWP